MDGIYINSFGIKHIGLILYRVHTRSYHNWSRYYISTYIQINVNTICEFTSTDREGSSELGRINIYKFRRRLITPISSNQM